MGDRKGVLSGRRYLVLCDKILWVELCEAGGRDSVTSKTEGDDEGRKQGEEKEGRDPFEGDERGLLLPMW